VDIQLKVVKVKDQRASTFLTLPSIALRGALKVVAILILILILSLSFILSLPGALLGHQIEAGQCWPWTWLTKIFLPGALLDSLCPLKLIKTIKIVKKDNRIYWWKGERFKGLYKKGFVGRSLIPRGGVGNEVKVGGGGLGGGCCCCCCGGGCCGCCCCCCSLSG
jgi:hypothetical protein